MRPAISSFPWPCNSRRSYPPKADVRFTAAFSWISPDTGTGLPLSSHRGNGRSGRDMAPQTIDFTNSGDALSWRRAQLSELLAGVRAGERVILKVRDWGEIHGDVLEYDGSALTLTSGRRIDLESVLDFHRSTRSAVA